MLRIFLVLLSFIIFAPVVSFAQSDDFAEERLKEYQQKHTISLSQDQKQKVIDTCSSHRNKLLVINNANDNAVRERLFIYGNIQKELKALELRMTRQGVDASELDLLIGKIDQQLTNFISLNQRHSNAVFALNSLGDCGQSPELYAAGIEELRTVRSELLEQAKDLKKTIIESPNTTFLPLIDRLLI